MRDELKTGLEALQELAGSQETFDAASFLERLVSGEAVFDAADLSGFVDLLTERAWRAFSHLALRLAVPVGLLLTLRLLSGRGRASMRAPELLCRLCVMMVLTAFFNEARGIAAELVGKLAAASEQLTPIISAIGALSGLPSLAGALTPISAMLADSLLGWLGHWGTGLCSLAAIIALIGGLSPDYPLRSAFDLVKRAQHWLLGGAMVAFTGLLTAHGAMGRAGDGLTLRAAKGLIEGVIPIIGGELSDITGILSGSAAAIRSALGITGVVALGWLCLEPILQLLSHLISLKLTAAILESATDAQSAELLGRFGDVLEMLLAICAISAALAVMLIGTCLLFAG